MTRVLAAGLLLFGWSLFGAETPRQQPQLSTTERLNFAPGGAVRLEGSYGCLSVEGWDRPEVEITVIRYLRGFYPAAKREEAARQLDAFKIHVERRSDKEVAISTERPRRGNRFSRFVSKNWGGVDLEYMIHVPRDSRLAIHHGGGSVMIADVAGPIEATSASGDIVAMLPDPGPYAIDARSKVGTVYSDFGDSAHTGYLVGERFVSAQPAPAKRVYLRTGIGGIEIQRITPGGF
jgi:hypothetical protein